MQTDNKDIKNMEGYLNEQKSSWKVILLQKGKKIEKEIQLGNKADKTDVKNQLKRMGIDGEILSIQKVDESE